MSSTIVSERQARQYQDVALLIGRILVGALFVIAAYGKFKGLPGTTTYFAKLGVPSASIMAPLVAAFELLVGVMLVVGFQTRLAAIAMAAFVIVAALLAHTNFGDSNQLNHFLKNLAIAGAGLALFIAGAGGYSVDGRSG